MDKEKEKMKKSKFSMYAIIFIAYFFVNFHRYAGSMSAPVLIEELSFSPSQIGWFGAIFTYSYALANLPAGILIDKFGSRRLIAILYAIAAFGTLILAGGNNFALIMLGRALIAAGIAPVYVAACKVIAEWEPTEHFPAVNGYLMAFGRAGGIIAATPLALMILAVGWRNTYYIFAAVSLVIAIAAWLFIKDKSKAQSQKAVSPFKGLKKLVSQRAYWLLVFFMMANTATAQNVFSNWGGVFLTNAMGYEAKIAANVLLGAAVASVIGALLAGTIVKRTSPKMAAMMGSSVLLIGSTILAFLSPSLNPMLLSGVFILMGFVEFFTISTAFSFLRTILPADLIGTALGIANFMMWGVGASVVAQLWGSWISADFAIAGFQTAFSFHAVILLIGLICVSFVKNKPLASLV